MSAPLPPSINDVARWSDPLQDETVAAMRRVAQRNLLILGPEVRAFEQEFASYLGARHAIGVASGSDALLLALRAIGAEGGRVIVAANAGAYGTLAVRAAGARPVFVDVERDSALMDLTAAARIIAGGGVSAVIVTHLYGRMQPLGDFVRSARASGVRVIEDCAQAHGARIGGVAAGTIGDVGCFSFYPTKNLGALGDGGALVTGDGDLAKRLASLRQYGWSRKYRIELPGGINSRLDEVQAAILRVRLAHLDRWNEARREIARRYAAGIAHPRVRAAAAGGPDYVAHLYVIRTPEREALLHHLQERGVPFDIHYPLPDHLQPGLASFLGPWQLPETEAWAREAVTLPCFPGMTPAEVDAVVATVNAW